MKTLSAIIFTRNSEKELSPCFNSVRSLTSDISVVDFGSTDNTKSMVTKYQARLVPEKDGRGYDEILNRFYKTSKADYFLYLFADEQLTQHTQTQIKFLLETDPPLDTEAPATPAIAAYVFKLKHEIGAPVTEEKESYTARLIAINEHYQFKHPVRSDIVKSVLDHNGVVMTTDFEIVSSKYRLTPELLRAEYMRQLKREFANQRNNAYSFYHIGKLLFYLNKYNESIEMFKKIDLESIADTGFLASIYNHLARAMVKQGMQTTALRLYWKSLDMVIEQNIANIELSSLYQSLNKTLEAVTSFERFYVSYFEHGGTGYYKPNLKIPMETGGIPFVDDDVYLSPEEVKQYMGSYYISDGRYEEGLEILNELLQKQDPKIDRYFILQSLSLAYQKTNQKEELAKILDILLKLDMTGEKKRGGMYDNLKQLILLQSEKGNYDEVSRYIQLGIQNFKYSIFFHYYRSHLYYLNRRYESALDEINTVLETYAHNRYKDVELPEVLKLKGNILFDQGMFQPAFETFRIILQTDTKNVDALYKLGQCLMNLKKVDEAKKIYTQALTLDPENALIQESLNQLGEQQA